MSNKTQEQRQRSKSKKKGICVSLTPSKIQQNVQISSFDISRCTVQQINDLPVIHLQSSNSKNHPKINITYQSPNTFSITKQRHEIDANDIKWPKSLSNVYMNENIHISEQKNIMTTAFADDIKSSQALKLDSKQIRSSVFEVVDEISSKMQSLSKNIQTHKQKLQNQQIQKSSTNKKQIKNDEQKVKQKVQVKYSPKKIQVMKKLEVIPERTLQTSNQLIKVESNQIDQNNLKSIQNHSLISRQSQVRIQQKRRIQRLKLAQQKLLNIIKVCDNGL